MTKRLDTDAKTFEEVYPTAPFSELIRLALLAATALRGLRDRTDNGRSLTSTPQANTSHAV